VRISEAHVGRKPSFCLMSTLKIKAVTRCGVTKTQNKSLEMNHFQVSHDTQRVTKRPPTNIAVGNKQTIQIIQETSPINIVGLKPRAAHSKLWY